MLRARQDGTNSSKLENSEEATELTDAAAALTRFSFRSEP